MKNKHPNIYKPLDKYEQELAEFLDQGVYESNPNLEDTKQMLHEAAQQYEHLNKTKRVTIRVNQQDLIKVKAKAIDTQIPYQRLINTLIHQYAQGKIDLTI